MTIPQPGLTQEKRGVRSRQSESADSLLQSVVEILDDLDTLNACIVLGRMKRLASSIRNSDNSMGAELSQREGQVLVLIAHGYTRRDIALSLGISSHTASRHISNIYSKLGISSVAEATTYALEQNLIAAANPQ